MKKLTLTGTVHSVHDTEVQVRAVVADGPLKGQTVGATVPCVLIEVVPGDPTYRSFTFPHVCNTPEEHAAALKAFGFGAEVTIDLTSTKDGKTPDEIKADAEAANKLIEAAAVVEKPVEVVETVEVVGTAELTPTAAADAGLTS